MSIRSVGVAYTCVGLTVACGDDVSRVCKDEVRVLVLAENGDEVFLRVRADDGDWVEPLLARMGDKYREFSFCSESHYTIAVACDDFTERPSVYQLNATRDEVPQPVGNCGSLADIDTSDFLVIGTMKEPGVVAIGDYQTGSSANFWPFELPIPMSGVYDVVAQSDARIAIRRAVMFEGPTDLGTIDQGAEGVDLVPIDLVVPDATPMATFRTSSSLLTSGGTNISFEVFEEPHIVVPPAELLLADDQLRFSLNTGEPSIGGYQRRGTASRYTNELTSIELPPKLPPAILPVAPELTLSLASLPTLPKAWVTVGLDDQAGRQMTVSTPGWITATGATEVAIDYPPDLDPKWLSPGGLGSWVSLDAYDAETETSRWTLVSLIP
ncbi:MAG: hypothetical protein AB7O24_10105 [Kofleriaceae bacterium]